MAALKHLLTIDDQVLPVIFNSLRLLFAQFATYVIDTRMYVLVCFNVKAQAGDSIALCCDATENFECGEVCSHYESLISSIHNSILLF